MSNRRALLFLLLSIVSGLAAVFAYRSSARDTTRVMVEPIIETTPVVMAREELPAGIAIEASQLKVIEWPSDYAPMGSIRLPEDVERRIPKRTIGEGEPILEQMLLEEGHMAGLSSLIAPNHRAMSVEADAVVGVGGFIKPGSRVDVLAQLRTHDREKGATPYSRTILQNVKVLAIDQDFEGREGTEPTLASVVTLEVDPVEAQLLSYAAAEGRLQLALRNQIDDDLVALKSTVPKDFLDARPKPTPKPRKKVSKPRPRPTIESIRGSEVSRDVL